MNRCQPSPILRAEPSEPASTTAERDFLQRLLLDDSGQDIVEYALLGALVGIAAILTWQQLATTVGIAYGATDNTGVQGAVQGLSSCTPDPGGGGC
jgi:pilus assembly protein Flp/PilA